MRLPRTSLRFTSFAPPRTPMSTCGLAIWSLIAVSAVPTLRGRSVQDVVAGQATQTRVSAERFLYEVGIPSEAVEFQKALTGMFDQVGHERRTLSGTIAQGGNSMPFLFTRELDQKVRLDLGGTSPQSLIVTQLNTVLNPTSGVIGGEPASWQQSVMEMLADDMPEGLLFSFGTSAKMVWLGSHYRPKAQVNGPEFDVYAKTANAGTQPGTPSRTKIYMFDSATKLLSSTQYRINLNGTTTVIEVSFTGWTASAGQMIPTSINRTENGQNTLSLTISTAASVAAQSDSLFNPGN